MTKRKILVFGKVAKDYIITDFPLPEIKDQIKREETNTVGNIYEYWGGSGLNVAAASSIDCFSNSVQTVLFTQAGVSSDPESIALRTLCEGLKIELEPISETYIPKICVLVEPGPERKRTFLTGPNGRMSFNISELKIPIRNKILDYASDAYAIVLAGLTPGSPFATIDMRLLINEMKAKNPNLIVALDLIASDFGEAQLSIFSSANYLLPSDAELPLLISDNSIRKSLREELEKNVAVQNTKIFDIAARRVFDQFSSLTLLGIKRGRAGSRVYKKIQGGNTLRVWTRDSISEERDLKDTTGAGDSWIGAFMASQSIAENPGDSAAFGNVIARYCISELGAITWRNQAIDCKKVEQLAHLVPGNQSTIK